MLCLGRRPLPRSAGPRPGENVLLRIIQEPPGGIQGMGGATASEWVRRGVVGDTGDFATGTDRARSADPRRHKRTRAVLLGNTPHSYAALGRRRNCRLLTEWRALGVWLAAPWVSEQPQTRRQSARGRLRCPARRPNPALAVLAK